MVRDYWYIIALSIVLAIISIHFNPLLLVVIFLLWLLMLQVQRKVPTLVILLALSSFFFFHTYIPKPPAPKADIPAHLDGQVTFRGNIVGPVEQTQKKVEFRFYEEQLKEEILIIYFPTDEKNELTKTSHVSTGASCQFDGELKLPDRASNPHQFDYQQYLLRKGITYQVILPTLSNIECTEDGIWHRIYEIRRSLIQSTHHYLEEDTVAWLHALVLGDQSQLDDDVIELFQRWSLSHILAISGLHIGIVVAMLYFILVKFSLLTKEKAQWFMIWFLPLYALIAGGQPSVWRASLMVLFMMLLKKFKWKLNYTDVVSIIFILLILVNPYIVYHIGFQLSFAVTFALIISQKWIAQASSNIERVLQISFISQMVILPLQIQYFSIFQPLSIIINLVVVPYFSFFVIPAMFGLMVIHFLPIPFIPLFERFIIFIQEKFLAILIWIDHYLYYPFVIGELSLYIIIVYYILFILMMKHVEQKQLRQAFAYGLLICLCIIGITLRPYFSPIGTVTMLDIGQGDAFVIELPYRKGVFFIDIGTTFTFPDFIPSETVYKNRIKPYLMGQGITKIDAVFLSHEHVDHYGSLLYAIGDIPIEEIIISPYYEVSPDIQALWNSYGIPVYRMAFNESITRNGQVFHALAPQRVWHDPNEDSLVLFSHLGGKDWIFTGDIGKRTEKELIKTYPNLQFDVLKVAHHGSDTSTEPQFVEATQPSVALMSVGKYNTYGHPAEEVVETLLAEEVTLYRTDKHGAVQYFFKEDIGMFKPFLDK